MPSSTDRAAERLAWLRATLGDDTLTLASASADASFRSYWRTHHQGRSWIVMDSPPALEDPAPWLALGQRLAEAGLHVPEVRAADLQRGLLLIEDLGTRMYLPELSDATVDRLYGDAMAALLRMQSACGTDGLAPYDRAFLARELAIMPEWFLGRHLGLIPDDDEQATLDHAFAALLDNALTQPTVFVHRDFHSRNLLVLDGDVPLASPGIIDFQGALAGPITYDLASLLRDCYITWPRARVEAWAEGYRLQLRRAGLIGDAVDETTFLRWFDLTGLQRHIKVLGIFCRLHYRDGKPGYLADLPRVFDYVIEVAAGYPQLQPLADLLARHAGSRDLTRPTGMPA
ncbi:aminoglycoside phosphotransferase family protein [Dyella sp.]|jgi:aminoglycoside/choline kinase family phosphotransferase|uniref:aminoglycoside phosphotransferase family protein n=1 Tax=Dyella sp. TaxID=1869338 RepID=UPI002D79E545|nr:phosphotransferase [Dyella sp.]HET6433819.1 phosphotransferase [Dyella sp.]